jgi:hypothetical protein
MRIRHTLCTLIVTGGIAALAAPVAGAATLAPANHDFGTQAVGTTSAAKAFTITNGCLITNPIGGGCLGGQITPTAVAVTGPFAQTNDCPPVLTVNLATCTINVTFTPTAAGTGAGALNTGAGSATLSGTGTTSATQGPVAAKKKKCKKKKKKSAAAAKKKCKKKK